MKLKCYGIDISVRIVKNTFFISIRIVTGVPTARKTKATMSRKKILKIKPHHRIGM